MDDKTFLEITKAHINSLKNTDVIPITGIISLSLKEMIHRIYLAYELGI